jgi:uncharacterized protein (DUF924 family)
MIPDIPADAQRLHEFWFGTLSDGFADEVHRQRWFSGGQAFDALCREEFASLCTAALNGGLQDWRTSPTGCLALILLLDQIPRNLFRGDPRAFSGDPTALSLSKELIRNAADQQLTFDQRAFVYLPLEHSEDLLDQHASVGLFTLLRDATPAGKRHLTGNYLQHAHQHRDQIFRFGRFPGRNAALDRCSSDAEKAFLAG